MENVDVQGPPIQAAGWDLSLALGSFNMVLAIGWDLPDDADVRVAVGESVRPAAGDAHCDRLGDDLVPRGYRASAADQYLVARAGGWECYPPARFHAFCANDPGLRLRLGDLRGFWREVVREVLALRALGPKEEEGDWEEPDEPVRMRFGPAGLTVGYYGDDRDLRGRLDVLDPLCTTDLNELNKLAGFCWFLEDGDSVKLVFRNASSRQEGQQSASAHIEDACLTGSLKVRFGRGISFTNVSLRVGDLRRTCRAFVAAGGAPGGLGAFEAVLIELRGQHLIMRCLGTECGIPVEVLFPRDPT